MREFISAIIILSCNSLLWAQTLEITLSNNEIGEGLSIGTVVGTLEMEDPEDGQSYYFSLTDDDETDNDLFYIENNNIVTKAIFDYDTRNVYIVKVKALDLDYTVYYNAFYIYILENNNWPTDFTLDADSVVQHAKPGTRVGVFSCTDADSADVHTYTIIDGLTDYLYTEDSLLLVQKKMSDVTPGSYALTVICDDNNGGILTKEFTLKVVASPAVNIISDTNTVCAGSTISLAAEGDTDFNWYIDDFENFLASGTETELLVDEACVVYIEGVNYGKDSLAVQISNDYSCYPLRVYECITPNNDGKNDVLYVENSDYYTRIEVRLTDKNRRLVFEDSDYGNDWDAGDVEAGNYIYTVTAPDAGESVSGTLLIVR